MAAKRSWRGLFLPDNALGSRIRPARVVLADHQSLVREALRSAIDRQPVFDVVGEAVTGCQAASVAREARADVVVLAADLPRCEGVEPTIRIKADVEDCHVVVLAQREDVADLLDALEAGASGYVTTRQPLEELIEALHAICRGETVVPPQMLGSILAALISRRRKEDEAARLVASLTPREREVLTLLGQGLGHGEIANRLFISAETARTHIKHVLHKLGVHSRLEAVAFAGSCGLLESAAVQP
jgi:DNA-binding NarL/FixJ family response regulator